MSEQVSHKSELRKRYEAEWGEAPDGDSDRPPYIPWLEAKLSTITDELAGYKEGIEVERQWKQECYIQRRKLQARLSKMEEAVVRAFREHDPEVAILFEDDEIIDAALEALAGESDEHQSENC